MTGLKRSWNISSQVTNNNTINGCYDVTPNFDITEVISIPSNKVISKQAHKQDEINFQKYNED